LENNKKQTLSEILRMEQQLVGTFDSSSFETYLFNNSWTDQSII